MRHSLCQKLLQQDPEIYRMTVTLRADGIWKLLSLPMSINGAIRALDQTFPELVQLAVHMDNSTDQDWQNGQVNAFWRGPPDMVREDGMTLLPAYVSMRGNPETLELGDFTPEEVAEGLRELKTLGEGASTQFLAAIELPPCGALSEALVGRRSWLSPMVKWEAETRLEDPVWAGQLYGKWQPVMLERLLGTYQQPKHIERRLYGESSFFLWQDRHPGEKVPYRDPDPAPEWNVVTHEKYCS